MGCDDDIRWMLPLTACIEQIVVDDTNRTCSGTVSAAYLLTVQPSPNKASGRKQDKSKLNAFLFQSLSCILCQFEQATECTTYLN